MQESTGVALRKLKLPVDVVHMRLSLYRRFESVPATADLIEDMNAGSTLAGVRLVNSFA